ncbi:hypothetical protein FRB94_007076 [Tulasnella sp. JGI-2019a]|nr:hypothetical protein FRB94_007076 [Tulasnella sp. JGI-2019a]KAG9016987.1 hypothetical protein FRB93_009517 [Tulasnella sp. JGI-2019a]
MYVCSICRWELKTSEGIEPPLAGAAPPPGGGMQFGGQQWGSNQPPGGQYPSNPGPNKNPQQPSYGYAGR